MKKDLLLIALLFVSLMSCYDGVAGNRTTAVKTTLDTTRDYSSFIGNTTDSILLNSRGSIKLGYSNSVSNKWIPLVFNSPATHLNFDGINDYIELPNESDFDFTNEMTVEFWMNSNQTPQQWDALLAKGDDSWRIALTSTGQLNFAGNGAFGSVTSNTVVTDGNWYHVAVTYNRSVAVIYVNGALDNSVAGTGFINNSNFKVSIGENLQAQGRYYHGDLDEVRIWNVARTAAQINRSKNCELQGNETGLVAYYRFNQGTDVQDNTSITSAADVVGGSNEGALVNFTLMGSASNFLAGSPVVTGATIPSAPAASDQSFCGIATVADLIPAPSSTVVWYSSETGGGALGTGATLNAGTYYVSEISTSGCESEKTPVDVTINEESSFRELKAPLIEGVWFSSVAFSDIDGDLDKDLLVTGEGARGVRVTKLYRNDGVGNFTEITRTPFAMVSRSSVAFSDVNGDGVEDVLITGDTGSSFISKLYLNDGLGNFTEATGANFVGVSYSSIAFSDVNRDGANDVLITGRSNSSPNVVSKLYINDGNANFTEQVNTPFTPVEAGSIAFADVNGDTFEDVLITGLNSNDEPNVAKLYTNDGNGNFTENTNSAFRGGFNSAIAFADVNGNGFHDVLITGYNTSLGNSSILYINDGSGNFSPQVNSMFSPVSQGAVAFADVNANGFQDVLISGEFTTKLYVNNGSGVFTEDTNTPFTIVRNASVAFSDVDGINGVDIFITGSSFNGPLTSTIYNNMGSGNFDLMTGPPFEGIAYGNTALSDFDNDGDQDLIIIGQEGSSGNRIVKYYDNGGSGNFTEVLNTPFLPVSEEGSIDAFDFDNDGDQDVLISGIINGAAPFRNIYINDGTGNFAIQRSQFEVARLGSLAISDVDGINGEDVLILGLNSTNTGIIAKLFLNDGTGSFIEKPNTQLEAATSASIGFADVDGINGVDVIISGQTSVGNETILYKNDGNGNFTKVLNTPFEFSRDGSIAFSDVDLDSDQDVLITGLNQFGSKTAKLYLNDGSGNFTEDTTNSFIPVQSSAISFADVDGVNGEDLLITGNSSTGRTATLYINDGSGNFSIAQCTPFDGVTNGSIAFADVDNDTDLDVVLTGSSNAFPSNITKLYFNDSFAPFFWSGVQDTDWENNNNWSNLSIPAATDNAFIRAGTVNKPIINSSTTAQVSTLNTDAGSTLTVHGILKVTKNITNEGELIFKSDASYSGQLDEFTGEIFGSGDMKVERYIPSKRAFRFISSPITTTASIFENWQEAGNSPTGFGTHITGSITGANGFDATETGSPSLFTFDNSTGAWEAIPNTDVKNLTSGSPYRLMVRGDRNTVLTTSNATPTATVLRSKGSLQTGDFSPVLSTSASAFSFVGNPYQAVVDFTQVATSNLSNFLYVWDASIAADGTYVSVDLSDLGAPAVGSSDASQFIAPGQAFFVRNTAAGNGSITFEENDKSVNSPQVTVYNVFTDFYINSQVYKTSDLLSGGMESDALGLRFRESYTTAGSDEDAVKFTNPGENYAVVNNGLRSIDKQNLPTNGHEIQLSLDNYTTTDYSLSFDMDNKPSDLRVFLYDAYLNTQNQLATDSIYNFTVDMSIAASTATNRFKLMFEQETLGLNTGIMQNISVYPNPAYNTLQIDVPATTQLDSVVFYNMLGQQMMSSKNKTIDITGLKTGVYLVEVITTQGQVTQKIIKK